MDFCSGASVILFIVIFLAFRNKSDCALLHQYFRVRPMDMEVVEGTQIEINCHVANRAGAVQWSKDGFVLGFQAEIPGFPRYEMVTNETRGIYNLRITSVQLEDEGEYQCQVGPARDMEPIRGKAHLTVLVPPKRLEIRHYTNGSAVQVKEGERVTLICRAHESRPAAQLKWYRDGQLLTGGLHHITHDEKARGRRRTTISVLTFYTKMEDHGIVYGCQALHTALRFPQIITVHISILHAPSSPKIEGYKTGDIVQVGDKLTLLCVSRGGNPPPAVLWYRNDVIVDKTYRNTPKETTNTFIFSVGGNDNNAELKCEVQNPITTKPLVATIRVRVLYSPTKVTLLGPTEAIVGEKVTVMCVSAPSNPPVEIYWMVDGRPVVSHQSVEESGPQGWVTSSNVTVLLTRQDPLSKTFTCHAASETLGETLVKSTTVNVLQPPGTPLLTGYHEGKHIISGELQRLLCQTIGGNPLPNLRWYRGSQELQGTMTISGTTVTNELLYRVQASDNGAVYRCEATNPALPHPLVTTISTNVFFGPLSISISLLPTQPKAGEEVTIICESGSSNPKAAIHWWKGDIELKSVGEKSGHGEYGGRTVRNLLKLNLTAEDNGSRINCHASNEILEKRLEDSLLLSVMFKPHFLEGNKKVFNVTEGKSAMLNMTAVGNPHAVSYVWYKVLSDGSQSEVRTSAGGGNYRFIYRGPVLHMFGVTRRDEGTYICQATNTEGSTNTSLLISVLYPAKVKKITTSVVLHEGDNAYLECFVEGNPLHDDMIKWRRDGFDMLRSQQITEGGRSHLTVFNVSRYDTGTFLCAVDNGLSEESVGTTQIFVKFLPNILREASYSNVASSVGESTSLPCIAEGYPPVTFVWSKNGEVLGGSDDKYSVHTDQPNHVTWKSVLLVRSVSIAEYGYYTCVAQNALGTDHTNLKLRERGRPDPPRTVHVFNYSSASVIISWEPGFDGGERQHFQIHYSPLYSATSFVSNLLPDNTTFHQIQGLKPATVYTFYVSATNSFGTCDENLNQATVKTLDINHSAGAEAATSNGVTSTKVTAVIVVSLLSSVLLVCNAILVTFFVRRRKKTRLMKKKSNNFQDDNSSMMGTSGNSSDLPPELFLQRTPEPCHREANMHLMTDRARIKNYKRNSERNREEILSTSLEGDILLGEDETRRKDFEEDILGVSQTRLIPLSYSLLEADHKCPDVMQNARYLHPL